MLLLMCFVRMVCVSSLVLHLVFIYVRCVTMAQPKKVLVCLGENRREVMFSGNAKDLLEGVVEVFSDVLSAQKISASQLVLQLKNEDWGGDFLDIDKVTAEIPDKSVIKVVKMSQLSRDTETEASEMVMEVRQYQCMCMY